MRRLTMLAVALLLAGCSAEDSAEQRDEKPRQPAEVEVDWGDYFPDLQQQIDRAARKGNCRLLQDQFDVADQMDGGNADLLDYIDAKLDAAGCYD